MPNLVWNLLIPSGDPLSALRVLARIKTVSGGASPRVNVLPAYYRPWGAAGLVLLGKTLKRIREMSDAGEIRLGNAARRGPVPLFNSGFTVDADGRCYYGNLILAVKTDDPAKALLAGDLNLREISLAGRARVDYPAIAVKIFGVKAVAGGFAADKLAGRVLWE